MGSTDIWWELRALRSEPPGLAVRSKRRKVFQAALEQCEQLLQTAAAAPLATRPLLAFYGVSQGSRAVLAAQKQGEGWAPHGHGLVALDTGGPLADTRIRDRSGGLFGALASAMGSASLPIDTAFTALAAAVPAFVTPAPCHSADLLQSLVLYPERFNSGTTLSMTAVATAWVSGLHLDLLDQSDQRAEVTRWVRSYPTLRGWTLAGDPDVELPKQILDSSWATKLVWHLDEPTGSDDVRTAAVRRCAINPAEREGALFVPPALAEPGHILSPLVHWWALLHAVSIIARYEPDRWRQLTDVDINRDAVGLESLLTTALRELPSLIVQAARSATEWQPAHVPR